MEPLPAPRHDAVSVSASASKRPLREDTVSLGKSEEPDTCRICRGEATEDEPLFYPCKCSGSIKYVHQSCLMEWLTHSQKKYCELCKTRFRFTKLYRSDMPKFVPLPVFIRRATIQTFRTLLTWMRFLLVAVVWLCLLPYAMRHIWRFLFWIADGGFENSVYSPGMNGSFTSPNFRIDGNVTEDAASAFITGASKALSSVLTIAGTFGFGLSNASDFDKVSKYLRGPGGPAAWQRHTWLSDVGFLKEITSSPAFNKALIDTLEGQLITLAVVVTFIVVFLIREWVIQQQPALNGGLNPEIIDQIPIEEQPIPIDAHFPIPEEPERNAAEVPDLRRYALEEENALLAGAGTSSGSDSSARNTDSTGHRDDYHEDFSSARMSDTHVITNNVHDNGNPSLPHRPVPIRDVIAEMIALRRTIEEEERSYGKQDLPALKAFMDIWQRADHQPDQALRLIEQENKTAELGWVIEAIQTLEYTDNSFEAGPSSPSRFRRARQANNAHIEGNKGLEVEAPDPSTSAKAVDRKFRFTDDSHPEAESSRHSVPHASGQHPQSSPWSNIPQKDFSWPSASTPNDVPHPKESGYSSDIFNTSESEEFPDNDSVICQPSHSQRGSHPEDTESSSDVASNASSTNDDPHHGASDDYIGEDVIDPIPISENTNVQNIPRGIFERMKDWLWGGVEIPQAENHEQGRDDAHIVRNLEAEAPFVPVIRDWRPQQLAEDLDNVEPAPNQDDAVALIPDALNDNDQDDIEDAEDLEGVLELIGLQGPLIGLLQNVIFSVVLISTTVCTGIWIPYIWGKIVLLFLADPFILFILIPFKIFSSTADLIVDTCLFVLGSCFYWADQGLRLAINILAMAFPTMSRYGQHNSLGRLSRTVAEGGLDRLADAALAFGKEFSRSGFRSFSIMSHGALHKVEKQLTDGIVMILGKPVAFIRSFDGLQHVTVSSVTNFFAFISMKNINHLFEYTKDQLITSLKMPNLSLANNATQVPVVAVPEEVLNPELAYWNTKDRIIAIFLGYVFFTLLGNFYLRSGSYFFGSRNGGRVEGVIADFLRQAGGVMKVILIISIEMIVFPLYCGILMDVALLPLFAEATLLSRFEFAIQSPFTSLFIHWFVGTCYMFHFALFVSMCRKILRPGVLYFVRDPDDPTFHPVRDVLERSVSTQLRKITFSALVYGALVIVCLGGVIWGTRFAFDGVLPIHWSSSDSILEFPFDLMFYNFIMPLVARILQPLDWLQDLYGWWFRKTARVLRLTSFLFGERKPDEEEHVSIRNRLRLRSNIPDQQQKQENDSDNAMSNARLNRDGKYVRAPASDQVRIPKGEQVFLEVNENNERLDGKSEDEDKLHASDSNRFTHVYIPPKFRLRIILFGLLIWLFAAFTGLSVTIVPLALGRKVFSSTLSPEMRMTDIYAYSVGITLFAGISYMLYCCYKLYLFMTTKFSLRHAVCAQILTGVKSSLSNVCRFVYTWGGIIFFLPSLFAFLMELYIVIPLHTYVGGLSERHIIHFVQDWTLGVLYVKTAARLILWYPNSRPAAALKAITRDGILKPDAGIATRGFLFPATLFVIVASVAPLPIGFALNSTCYATADSDNQIKVYRYSYPIVFLLALSLWAWYFLSIQIQKWRLKIRDDVYLIGERLHNFGEKRINNNK